MVWKAGPRERFRRNSCWISASISNSQTPGRMNREQPAEGPARQRGRLPDEIDLDRAI